MSIEFRRPSATEFEQICDYIREFELDNRGLMQDEFTAAFRNGELLGFGRLRNHIDCTELCSLGVVTSHRKKGIGKAIVLELIKRSKIGIHLVCIIPDFFSPLGFIIIENFPPSIQNKIDYCTSELVVPEKYEAMWLQK
jgi:N-acetylglutamate synthase-like GNAT family acetyltransferase